MILWYCNVIKLKSSESDVYNATTAGIVKKIIRKEKGDTKSL